MNTLRWAPYPGADVAFYKIFRSIVGFRAPVVSPVLLDGLTLQLKMNGGPVQTITFDAMTAPVLKINDTLQGGRAYPSIAVPNTFIVRSDIREAPGTVEIVGGSSLEIFELGPKILREKSEDEQIQVVVSPEDPDQLLTFQDPDGAIQDFYALATVDNLSNQSNKTAYKQPVLATGNVCVIEGIVTNLQGARMADQEVTAFLVKYPHASAAGAQVTVDPVTVLTGADGRYSITLLQGAIVQITIQSLGFSSTITVPPQPFAFITDLSVELDYQYPLSAIGVET